MSSNNLIFFSAKDLRNRLIVLTGVLLIIGLVSLYSISDNPLSIGSSFFRQCIFILLSSFVYILMRNIPLKTIHDNSTTIFVGIAILCFIPFFLPQVEYTYRWIDFGFSGSTATNSDFQMSFSGTNYVPTLTMMAHIILKLQFKQAISIILKIGLFVIFLMQSLIHLRTNFQELFSWMQVIQHI